jgi:hypothetical protein
MQQIKDQAHKMRDETLGREIFIQKSNKRASKIQCKKLEGYPSTCFLFCWYEEDKGGIYIFGLGAGILLLHRGRTPE